MDSSRINTIASVVIEALHGASMEKPDALGGEPDWYYDLASRIAAIVGDSPIQFVSHTFTDATEQDAVAWLFTDKVVAVASVKGSHRSYELEVEVLGRKTLRDLSVDRVSDAFTESGPVWPARLTVSLTYAGRRTVTLPLEKRSYQLAALAELLPDLANDLNGPQ